MVKEWGFVFKPSGTIDAVARFLILIGYPFSGTTLNVPPVINTTISYYRKYTNDMKKVQQTSPLPLLSLPTAVSLDLPYFRKYLGERT